MRETLKIVLLNSMVVIKWFDFAMQMDDFFNMTSDIYKVRKEYG